MKLLLVNWKDPAHPAAGGAEQYVERVAEHWVRLGHAVDVVVPTLPDAPHTEARRGVTWRRMGRGQGVFAAARQYVRGHVTDYDLFVESVSTRPFFLHELVGDRAVTLYYQLADDVWNQEFAFPFSWIGRRIVEPTWLRRLRRARVVTISESTAEDLAVRGITVEAIVPPGCDPAAEPRPPRSGGARLLFLGRMVKTKRPMDAITAFARIHESLPDAMLDVVGGGYLVERLRECALPGVRVHGRVSEERKHELLAAADAVLLPGTREGWGIVAIEAASHGVPVVAYRIPGLRDAVVEGHTGILTEPSPQALADAALALLADPARWESMSAAARSRSLRFTWENTALALLGAITAEGREALAAARG